VNKPRSISLRMEEHIYETINTLARNDRRTFSNAVHMILELGLERYRDIKKQEKSL
jgi:predicted DNA-binding protein